MIRTKKAEQKYFITQDGVKIPLTKNWKQIDKQTLVNEEDGSVFIFCRMTFQTKIKTKNTQVYDLMTSIKKYGGFFISKEHAAMEDGKVVFRKSNNIISLDKNIIRKLMEYNLTNKNNVKTIFSYNTGSKRINVITPLKMLYDYIRYNKSILKMLNSHMVELSFECEPVKLDENETVNTGIRGVLVIK